MSRRSKMQPVYVGDIGEVWIIPERRPLPSDEEIETLDLHQLVAVALECGVKLYDIIGIRSCGEHYNMVLLGANAMPQGFNLIEHCNFCKNCFQLFRLKKLV